MHLTTKVSSHKVSAVNTDKVLSYVRAYYLYYEWSFTYYFIYKLYKTNAINLTYE